jgi:peptidoglycan/xylan/chitin deacetylase (PgdA/CDA1 family)
MSKWFCWTNDDAGSGDEWNIESVRRSCAYLESRGKRGTWFVVPKPGGNRLSDAWKSTLRAARDAGHDLQLHGLTHADCFEFGPPVVPAITISPAFVEKFREREQEHRARYTPERLRARLEEGIALFQEDLGVTPTVFRAPCGAISEGLFEALAAVGLRYETSQYVNLGCYNYLPSRNRPPEMEWSDRWPHRPFRWIAGVTQYPILGEYTWRDAWKHEEAFRPLAVSDCERILGESDVAVLLSHTHGINSNYDYSFRTFDLIFERTEALGARWETMGELARRGELDAAAFTPAKPIPVTDWTREQPAP